MFEQPGPEDLVKHFKNVSDVVTVTDFVTLSSLNSEHYIILTWLQVEQWASTDYFYYS